MLTGGIHYTYEAVGHAFKTTEARGRFGTAVYDCIFALSYLCAHEKLAPRCDA